MSTTINRRTFLAASAAMAAAPMIIPATAWGQNGPSNRIHIGCIGLAGMGMANINSFLRHDDCRVIALCDVDRNVLCSREEAINNHYGDQACRSYTDYRELIAQDDIDAVMIATPDHWHAPMAMAAAKAGKDIYCEKPITHTFAEGARLMATLREHDCIWQMGAWQRSQFHFRRAVDIVQNGLLGEIQFVDVGLPSGEPFPPQNGEHEPPDHVDYDAWCGPSPMLPFHPDRFHFQWRWNYHFGAGQLMDWIGHHNDIAHWALEEELGGPVAVQMNDFRVPERTDVWDASWRYEMTCWYEKGFATRITNRTRQGVTFYGSEGWVHVSRGTLDTMNPEWKDPAFDPGPKKAYVSDDHTRNFLDCIKSREPAITPAESAHHSITPGHLGLISAALGNRRLEWDPVNEALLNDEDGEATKLLNQQGDRMPWMPWREEWAGDLLDA